MALAEKILELRTSHGLSQGDLAEALDVSRQSVSKWETGQSVPDLDKIIKLADLFDVTVDQLVRDRDTSSISQPPRSTTPCGTDPAQYYVRTTGYRYPAGFSGGWNDVVGTSCESWLSSSQPSSFGFRSVSAIGSEAPLVCHRLDPMGRQFSDL